MISPGIEVNDARLAAICDKYGIGELQVFASGARGNIQPDSDIDILYALRPGHRARLGNRPARRRAELFSRPVDLVSLRALHPAAPPRGPRRSPATVCSVT
jgi:predicted nucleotidyltransferase